jgi:hypothetical protein
LSDAFINNQCLSSICILNAGSIQENTFKGCHNLKRLVLPGIENLTVNLFSNTKDNLQLEEVSVCAGNKQIGTNFSKIVSLTSIQLSPDLETLEKNALCGTSIDKLFIPASA